MLGKEEFCNLSWTRYFELWHPLMLFQKSANSVFQKEVEMWERIHYLANDSKIQKTITEQVPRIYKGFSFPSLFSRLQIPDRKATESPISPTVLIVDKFWRKKNTSAQFMFFTPNEVRNSSQTHEAFLVYWNLISVKCTASIVTALASICIDFSCIALKVCFSWLITQMALNTHQWRLLPFVHSVQKELHGNFHTSFQVRGCFIVFSFIENWLLSQEISDYGFPSPYPS